MYTNIVFVFLLSFSAFSHALSNFSLDAMTVNAPISCNWQATINITDGKLQVDHSWLHNGLHYGLGLYGKFNYVIVNATKQPVPEHIRGCIGLLTNVISACCPPHQMVQDNRSTKCIDREFGPLIHMVGLPDEAQEEIDISKEFTWVHNPVYHACKKIGLETHYLTPEEYDFDEWFLAKNGSIYLPDDEAFFEYDKHCVSVTNNTVMVLRCYEPQTSDKRYSMLGIGMIVSVPFLVATFIVYAVIPELRNVHGLSLMSYVGGLAVGYGFLGSVQLWGSQEDCHNGTKQCFDPYFCSTSAYITYFGFMVAFFWLNTMCFDIFWTFRGVRGNTSAKKNFMYYCIYSWGMASFLTILTLSLDMSGIDDTYKPGMYMGQQCFLKQSTLTEFIYLYSIMLILICANIVFFGVTAFRIKKVQSETAAVVGADSSRRHSRNQYDNYRFMLYLRLFIIMGVTWSMECLSWFVAPESPWFYVTDLLNCLQGPLIFLLVVCNEKVRKLVIKRYYRCRGISPPETGTTFSDTRNSRISTSSHRHNSIQMEQRNTLLVNRDNKEIKDNNSNKLI